MDCRWEDSRVPTTDEPQRRLGNHVRERRLVLGLSTQKAADQASVSRQTWINIENGARRTNAANHAALERTLRWRPGSVAAVLNGDDPTPLAYTSPETGRTIADLIREINELDLPVQTKLDAIHELIQVHRTTPGDPDVADRRDTGPAPDTQTG